MWNHSSEASLKAQYLSSCRSLEILRKCLLLIWDISLEVSESKDCVLLARLKLLGVLGVWEAPLEFWKVELDCIYAWTRQCCLAVLSSWFFSRFTKHAFSILDSDTGSDKQFLGEFLIHRCLFSPTIGTFRLPNQETALESGTLCSVRIHACECIHAYLCSRVCVYTYVFTRVRVHHMLVRSHMWCMRL